MATTMKKFIWSPIQDPTAYTLLPTPIPDVRLGKGGEICDLDIGLKLKKLKVKGEREINKNHATRAQVNLR